MVRLMTYANQVDIEGLVATPTGPKDEVNPQRIQRVVAAYGKVRDNLELHEPGYPAAEHLLSCIAPGLQTDGMDGVGEGRDSPGSSPSFASTPSRTKTTAAPGSGSSSPEFSDRLTARVGERVHLSAAGSNDPDGDALSYEWFCYAEAGTRGPSSSTTGVKLPIRGFDQPKASFDVTRSRVMPPGTGTMHIILAVTDHGTPRLTRYRRVIVDIVQ